MSLQLELRGLSKSFGSRHVFEGISETVEDGQCLVVTGPNGSGKSTLLRIIAGLIAPSAGEVRIWLDGQNLDRDQRRDVAGMVAPDVALYDELSALENLRFFAQVRGLPAGLPWLLELLDRMGLSGRESDLLGAYSSGMEQRMRYAFALLHRPPLLLLDEPTANLDASGAEAVAQVIAEQKREGVVVLATNDPRELAYGDKIVELGG